VQTTGVAKNSTASKNDLLRKLSFLRHKTAQTKFFARHPELLNAETVVWLADQSRDQTKVDTASALSIAKLSVAVANRLKDPSAYARSFRAMGNALYVTGQNNSAVAYHERARRIFVRLKDRSELARTLSASIQPLILAGQYDHAFANAKQASKIFTSLRDHWRLARVDLNTGNIFHRQDRFAEALKWYRRAHRYFARDPEKDPEAMGVALHNIAMCRVSLNDFAGAMDTHQQARTFANEHDMRVLVAQTDYNIAALYYLRGEHSRAIRILLDTLKACKATKDHYHAALCYLDLSEIYLQLNLSGPARDMAQAAAVGFEKLRMDYEAGKSQVNLALAMARQNESSPALRMLANARRLFVEEKNSAWPFLTDFYQAIVLTTRARYCEASNRCHQAHEFFRKARIPDKLVLTHLLLAQLSLLTGKLAEAARSCSQALGILDHFELLPLTCQAHQLMGRIHLKAGSPTDAWASYQKARHLLEAMRVDLRGDELKISFMEDKLEIYESLVQLCLEAGKEQRNREAFTYIEEAKSRSLQDLMSQSDINNPELQDEGKAQSRAGELRCEINSYSRRLAEEQLRDPTQASKNLSKLRTAIHRRETELLRIAREEQVMGTSANSSSVPATLEEIRTNLPMGSTLLEYFQVQDQLLATIVSRKALNIVPVGHVGQVIPALEHLDFQLAKFRLDSEYLRAFGGSLLTTTQRHLKNLYNLLITPIEGHLDGQHLVVVPHGRLHRLPFQALYDGEQYFIDKFRISYAPSATIHTLCNRRPLSYEGPSLVMGISDAMAPLIADEANAVANILPRAQLLLNSDATRSALYEIGSQCRFIHIASHGYYRQDSPMFSGIKMGDSVLSLYDLYRFKLRAELIVLSGCATGVSTAAAGDELLGLVRGLVYAGARAALLTLWDVQDRSTLEFMKHFYTYLMNGESKTAALQKSVQNIRESYAHPYYWAPFSLVGNLS
jgi:tetratricopeptide (TPR) repeat protein